MNGFRYAGIETFDINNGTGFGITLFVQGCTHHCNECHNPQTWDFNGGEEFDRQAFEKLKELISNENIVRLTISGGEPFDNYCAVLELSEYYKKSYPEKQLWIYTGYTYEDLMEKYHDNKLLDLCDVLVDGEYKKEQRDLSLPFRGSKNQRIIDMNETRKQKKIVCKHFNG